MTQTNVRTAIVMRPRSFILLTRIQFKESHALLVFGHFDSVDDAEEWDTDFRTAALVRGVVVPSKRVRAVWPNSKQRIDYDCQSDDGLPWEVATDLHLLIPRRHTLRLLMSRQRRITREAGYDFHFNDPPR